MLFPVKFTVYIVYVQLGPNKLLNKSMVCSHFVPMVVLYSIILYSSWVQNDSTNWVWHDCGCETIGNQIYTILLPSLQLTPHQFCKLLSKLICHSSYSTCNLFFQRCKINSPSSLPYSFYSLYNQTILCPLKFFLPSNQIPAFRSFKVNSYFVGTCKRKIRVEQVKSP